MQDAIASVHLSTPLGDIPSPLGNPGFGHGDLPDLNFILVKQLRYAVTHQQDCLGGGHDLNYLLLNKLETYISLR